jgi:spermidine/putrescine transport system ATP-binding protein
MPTSPAAAGPDSIGARPDLQVERVSKRYGSFTAVDDLSLDVARGSFFSILGPSGCGKTTLLRMVAGFMSPDAGDIRIGGNSMRAVPPNQRPVNMVFQHLAAKTLAMAWRGAACPKPTSRGVSARCWSG